MFKKIRFPIRIKFLVVLLLLITVVVSTITFTMARLFHTDKTAYIHDLTSVIALHTALEAGSLLTAYQERLKVFYQFMSEQNLAPDHKNRLLEQLFEDFEEFVAVTLYVNGVEQATVYDSRSLTSAGLTKDDLLAYRAKHPLPTDLGAGQVFIKNSTITGAMPCFTMAVSVPQSLQTGTALIAAVVRLDQLLHLAGRSKVFETFVVDVQGNLLAHRDPKKIAEGTQLPWLSQIKGLVEKHTRAATIEYVHEGEPMVAGLAHVGSGDLLAVVQIPKAAAYLTARELLNNLLYVALALLVLSAVVSLVSSRMITRHIKNLSNAVKIVGTGRFDVRVESSSGDEIGDLAVSFNQMAVELDAREKALKNSQAALIQSEKMAAFGQLGAGIAHEVKNPLAGILGYAQLTLRKLEAGTPLHENLRIIEKETKRCKDIMENLLKFARQDKVEYAAIDLNRIVTDACAIVRHQLALNKVKLEQDLAPELPGINGNANQLQQVLMNLMINAQQAMNGTPGTVTISTRHPDPAHVELRIKDTGPGMSAEVQKRIFDPFYTTKPAGKGTGLGLSVSFGIVKDHKGEIQVESEEGKGAEFVITLPVMRAGASA
jgi:two-component system NtrC family sensor kinase